MVCSTQHHLITIFKQQITWPKTSFGKKTLPSVAVFSRMRLSRMLLRKFHQKTAKGISETLVMSSDSTEGNDFEPFCFTHRCFMRGILQRGITELSLVIVNDFLGNC